MNELITTTNSAGNLVLKLAAGHAVVFDQCFRALHAGRRRPSSPYTVSKTAPKQFFRVQR